MALGWVKDIEAETLANDTFRTVLFTGQYSQVTVMSIQPGDDIGLEVHDDRDQFLRIEQGDATVVLSTSEDAEPEVYEAHDDWAIVVPAGVWHNVTNSGDQPLKLYSVYSPAEHPADTVHQTKAEADAAEAEAHGHA